MAKRKAEVNKSAEIRGHLKSNPQAKPKEIVAALKEKGVHVTAAFVSTIKSISGLGSRRRKVRRASASSNGYSVVTAADLLIAKEFAKKFGGVAHAKATLDALVKLQ